MANLNEQLVKFGYGLAEKAKVDAGYITFASDSRQLFVGNGTEAVAFAGNVANAVFADKKLTITYNDGTAAAVLDFSDVASAEGVSSLLSSLRDSVNVNATAIESLGESVKALQDKDSSIDAEIAAVRGEFAAADASIRTDVSAYQAVVDASVATNAGNISDVSNRLNVHATDASLHLAEGERARWTDAAEKVEVFFKDASINADPLKDTLKEIQDYIASDASAAAAMTESIAKAQKTADDASAAAATAQATADGAAGAVTALDGSVSAALNLKADKTQVADDIAAAETRAAADASAKASAAQAAAEAVAKAIKVNGQGQDASGAIVVTGEDIKVTSDTDASTVSAVITDLYAKVGAAATAGVTSFAIDSNDSLYAKVNASVGAVALDLNVKTLEEAGVEGAESGLADAKNVKEYVDASVSAVDEKVEALNDQLTWEVIA